MTKIGIVVITLFFLISLFVMFTLFLNDSGLLNNNNKVVPHEEKWGIYGLNLDSGDVRLLYSSPNMLTTLRLSFNGDLFVFSQRLEGESIEHEEICTVGIDGSNFQRLTENTNWDLYPAWSSDATRIVFLSFRDDDLDIYVMDVNGNNVKKLYDSGYHDADVHWEGDAIVFTANSRIWMMGSDGTDVTQITDPPRAGEWGDANLPFGDYDPRLSPDGDLIVFERLEDDTSPHGNYNLFTIKVDGTQETRLSENGYSQGLASWSHSGDKIAYTVSAINDAGKYDIYMMNKDGENNHLVTPDYFPEEFLCHSPIFSIDDSVIYFIGEWWD